MRITLSIDSDILRAAKQLVAAQSRRLGAVISDFMKKALLLELVHYHAGELVTLDSGIPKLLEASAERKRWVELITL